MTQNPFIDYRFLGIRSFLSVLDESGEQYRLFEDDNTSLFRDHPDILNAGEDTITTGLMTRAGQGFYFTQFAIRITKSYCAHIVFIFDHHPSDAELGTVIDRLEGIVNENLNNVNVQELADAMEARSSLNNKVN